jgi:hypothetical protein
LDVGPRTRARIRLQLCPEREVCFSIETHKTKLLGVFSKTMGVCSSELSAR